MGNCVASNKRKAVCPTYSLAKSAINSENKKRITKLLLKLGTIIYNSKQKVEFYASNNKKERALEYRLLQILYEEKLEKVQTIIANPKKLTRNLENKDLKDGDLIEKEIAEIENWIVSQETSKKSLSYSERKMSFDNLREKYDFDEILKEINHMVIRSKTT